jgi:zinc and cadmium transporter
MILGGFVALAIIEWLIGHHHHHEHGIASPTLPPTLLISDALHNIGDVAAGFLSSTKSRFGRCCCRHRTRSSTGSRGLRHPSSCRLAPVASTSCSGMRSIHGIPRCHRSDARCRTRRAPDANHPIDRLRDVLILGATDLLPEIHSRLTSSSRTERVLGFAAGIAIIALVSVFSAA